MENTLEKNYICAAIDALNRVVTSDVTPRLASKVVRFRTMLQEYVKTYDGGTRTAIESPGGAKDADGNEIADVHTV